MSVFHRDSILHVKCYFRCQRSVHIDRQQYEESKMLVCPLPDCNHTWCKACQQSVTLGGPPHSCDGTLELDHLMNQHGWKYCPSMSSSYGVTRLHLLSLAGCRTPVQKNGGCNHMSVRDPFLEASAILMYIIVHFTRLQHSLLLLLWPTHRA